MSILYSCSLIFIELDDGLRAGSYLTGDLRAIALAILRNGDSFSLFYCLGIEGVIVDFFTRFCR